MQLFAHEPVDIGSHAEAFFEHLGSGFVDSYLDSKPEWMKGHCAL